MAIETQFQGRWVGQKVSEEKPRVPLLHSTAPPPRHDNTLPKEHSLPFLEVIVKYLFGRLLIGSLAELLLALQEIRGGLQHNGVSHETRKVTFPGRWQHTGLSFPETAPRVNILFVVCSSTVRLCDLEQVTSPPPSVFPPQMQVHSVHLDPAQQHDKHKRVHRTHSIRHGPAYHPLCCSFLLLLPRHDRYHIDSTPS